MSFYWELKYGIYDDIKNIMVSPTAVDEIKKRILDGNAINLDQAVVLAKQVKSFEITDKPFRTTLAIEEASQVFNEPIIDSNQSNFGYIDEAVRCRWVKKTVTMDKWSRYFSQSPGYKYLAELNGFAVIGFRSPVHVINPNNVDYCSLEEITQLTK